MSKTHLLSTKLILSLAFLFLTSCAMLGRPSADKRRQAELKIEIASGLIKGSNYPAALRELLSAEEDDPTNPMLHHLFGMVYLARERYELAEKHYLKALQLNNKFTDVRNSLAVLYMEIGRLNKAEEQLNLALNDLTYLDYHKTYINWGLLEFKRKSYSKAAQFFKKGLEKDRESCSTHVMLGRSLLEMNDFQPAIEQLERAMIFCNAASDDSAHYFSAIAYYRKQEIEKSMIRFEETLKIFPEGKNYDKARKMLSLIKNESP